MLLSADRACSSPKQANVCIPTRLDNAGREERTF